MNRKTLIQITDCPKFVSSGDGQQFKFSGHYNDRCQEVNNQDEQCCSGGGVLVITPARSAVNSEFVQSIVELFENDNFDVYLLDYPAQAE